MRNEVYSLKNLSNLIFNQQKDANLFKNFKKIKTKSLLTSKKANFKISKALP